MEFLISTCWLQWEQGHLLPSSRGFLEFQVEKFLEICSISDKTFIGPVL
jgi:hypothetical protein